MPGVVCFGVLADPALVHMLIGALIASVDAVGAADTLTLSVLFTDIPLGVDGNRPTQTGISQIAPNPFNPSTTIRYTAAQDSESGANGPQRHWPTCSPPGERCSPERALQRGMGWYR